MKILKNYRFILLAVFIFWGSFFLFPFFEQLTPIESVAAAASSINNPYQTPSQAWLAGSSSVKDTVTATSTETATRADPNLIQLSTPTRTPTNALTPSATQLLSSKRTPTPTPTPLLPKPSLFGADIDQVNSAGGLDQMEAANIVWARISTGIKWSNIESTQGTYDWSVLSSLETELENASNNGIQVILFVNSTPEWARKDGGSGPWCGPMAKNKFTAFGNFMHELVSRLSVAPYNVKYWEIWNEEDIGSNFFSGDNVYGCWGNSNDKYYGGGYYAQMLKVVYPAIKAADPQSQVLIGGLLLDCNPQSGAGCAAVGHDPKPARFLEGILKKIRGRYFDGISFHAYDSYRLTTDGDGYYENPNWQSSWNTTGPVGIAKAQFIQGLLKKYHVTGKFLMDTETAILCGNTGAEPACQAAEFSDTKVDYVAQLYSSAIAQGLKANLWYSVFGWRASGLLNRDLSPNPAYTALAFSESELRNVAYAGDINNSDIGGVLGIKGYKFVRDGRRVWVIWSLDGNLHTINFPQGSLFAVWDVLGNSLSITSSTSSLGITKTPLYLEWE